MATATPPRMERIRSSVQGFDGMVKEADPRKMQEMLRKFNLLVGLLLVVISGVLAGIENLTDAIGSIFLVEVSSASAGLTHFTVSLYCFIVGVAVVMFEATTKPSMNKWFRVNMGFYLTYNGRIIFLILVAALSCSIGALGMFTGAFIVADVIFHIFVRIRNPNMAEAILLEETKRMTGSGEYAEDYEQDPAQAGGLMQSVADKAWESPGEAFAIAKTQAATIASVAKVVPEGTAFSRQAAATQNAKTEEVKMPSSMDRSLDERGLRTYSMDDSIDGVAMSMDGGEHDTLI